MPPRAKKKESVLSLQRKLKGAQDAAAHWEARTRAAEAENNAIKIDIGKALGPRFIPGGSILQSIIAWHQVDRDDAAEGHRLRVRIDELNEELRVATADRERTHIIEPIVEKMIAITTGQRSAADRALKLAGERFTQGDDRGAIALRAFHREEVEHAAKLQAEAERIAKDTRAEKKAGA